MKPRFGLFIIELNPFERIERWVFVYFLLFLLRNNTIMRVNVFFKEICNFFIVFLNVCKYRKTW